MIRIKFMTISYIPKTFASLYDYMDNTNDRIVWPLSLFDARLRWKFILNSREISATHLPVIKD